MNKLCIHTAPSNKFPKYTQSLYMSFGYNLEAFMRIQQIKQKAYIEEDKVWELPITDVNTLLNIFNDFEVVIKGMSYTDFKLAEEEVEEFVQPDFQFKTEPFQHQIEGINFGKKTEKFLLADDQGLGKTKQAIDLAVSRKGEFKHCLIVCGVSSVKKNWLKEIEIHSNETGHILGSYVNSKGILKDDGSMKDRLDDLHSDLDDFFLITNIETFKQGPKSKTIKSMTPQELIYHRILQQVEKLTLDGTIGMVVIDEIHKAKNPTSLQGKAIHRLQSKYRMALTGTPVVNSPIDVYNILKWLDVEQVAFTHFKNYYTIQGGFGGYEVTGYKNLERLQSKLNGVMLRRKKEDVLDLPPKIRSTEYIEMNNSQTKLYNEIRDEILEKIEDIYLDPNPLAMLTRLRQVTSCPATLSKKYTFNAKFDRMKQLVQESVEGGQKVIVFSNWSKVTKAAKEFLAEYNPAYIDGEVNDRMKEVTKFQEDANCQVIIGTIGAMGTGLTLTAGSNVIFIDKPWNPANTVQAEDRAHRIGTTGTVNIITLVVPETIDERIEELIADKQDAVDGLVEGESMKLQKIQMIRNLLN